MLDSRKTGCFVKEDIFKSDKRNFNKDMPPSLQSRKRNNSQLRGDQNLTFKRDRTPGEFVLDCLLNEGRKMQDDQIKRYNGLKPRSFGNNEDLLQPWKKMKQSIGNSSPVGADLALIKTHVDAHIKEWQAITRRTSNKSMPSAKRSAGAVHHSVQAQYDELRDRMRLARRSHRAPCSLPL